MTNSISFSACFFFLESETLKGSSSVLFFHIPSQILRIEIVFYIETCYFCLTLYCNNNYLCRLNGFFVQAVNSWHLRYVMPHDFKLLLYHPYIDAISIEFCQGISC